MPSRITVVTLMRLSLPIATLIALGVPGALSAQSMTCLQSSTCVIEPRGTHAVIAVRINGVTIPNDSSHAVYFHASGGKVTDSARVRRDGVAQAVWTGEEDGDSIVVRATFATTESVITRNIVLKGGPAASYTLDEAPRKKALRNWFEVPNWYQGRQLKDPVGVVIRRDPSSPAAPVGSWCTKQKVVFRALGESGTVTVDTARAQVYRNSECEARTHWRLGTTVGEQMVRASLVGGKKPEQEFRAHSRALPWFGTGLAWHGSPGYVGVEKKDKKISITSTRTDSVTGITTELATDSTVTVKGPDPVGRGKRLAPVLSVNFPLILGLQWLRLSIASDLASPTTRGFVGVSMLQPFHGFTQEDTGFDLHLVAEVTKRDELKDAPACAASGSCDTRPRTIFGGVGVMVMVNAASVFDKLFTVLLPK